MILSSLKGKSTFSRSLDIVTSISTNNSLISSRNNKRIGQVLISEPLIHDEAICSERKSIDRKVTNTSRNTHVISNRTNIPTAGWSGDLGNLVLDFREPGRLRVLAIKLTPMIPNKTIGNKEKVRVKIDIIHNRGNKRRHTNNLGSGNVKGIARKNLVNVKRDNISNIEGCLKRVGTIKRRTGYISMRKQRKMRLNVSIHKNTSLLYEKILYILY